MKKSVKITGLFLLIMSMICPMQASGRGFQQTLTDVDVIVCGAEPEGIAAAVSASEGGLNTVLIDTRGYPGGLYTSGMLTMLDLNYNESKEKLPIVNQGIFAKWYKHIGKGWRIQSEETKTYFNQLLQKKHVKTFYNITNLQVEASKGCIQSITFKQNGIPWRIHARYVIDAMQEAPIARAAGADYYLGREDLGLNTYAGATLVFSVKNVDWEAVCKYVRADQNEASSWSGNCAWGYAKLLDYQPVIDPKCHQLRGLNLAHQDDGSVVINAFQIFGVDALDKEKQQIAYEKAIQELPYIMDYLRGHAEGFKAAQLAQVADELYLREGVRIVGEETLRAEDCLSHRDFPNKIAYGSYPIDLQSTKKDGMGGNSLSSRSIYTIPMGVMLPHNLEEVLVVGRSASYDSIAHGSSRTVPVGIALGEAAGQACIVGKALGVSLKEINRTPFYYHQVQERLMARGVSLFEISKDLTPEKLHWSYPAIQYLRQQGFITKTEKEGYACKALATYSKWNQMVGLMKAHGNLPINVVPVSMETLPQALTKHTLVDCVYYSLPKDYLPALCLSAPDESLEVLYNEGLLQKVTYENLKQTKEFLTNGTLYAVLSDVVYYLRKQNPLPSEEALHHNDVVKLATSK